MSWSIMGVKGLIWAYKQGYTNFKPLTRLHCLPYEVVILDHQRPIKPSVCRLFVLPSESKIARVNSSTTSKQQ